MAILEAMDIHLQIGGFHVLNGVSISVPHDSIVGIVGTNGAGKSSLFAAISGQLPPSRGTVILEGREITATPPRKRAQMGLGRTFQVPREFKDLTVLENMLAAAPRRYGETLRSVYFGFPNVKQEEKVLVERARDWLKFLNLEQVAYRPAGGLSGGQKKLLELGRVLMLSPRCILLDEPFAGVNPVLIQGISEKIQGLNKTEGIAFVIIEHHLEAVTSLADFLYAMNEGLVIAEGSSHVVMNDPRVHNAYMGGVI